MQNNYIDVAKAAEASKDWQKAIEQYQACLQDVEVEKAPGDLGYLYHRIGNAYLRQRDFDNAIAAYEMAISDVDYDACGAVNSNLGKAYAAMENYEQAVAAFEVASSDVKYPTRYKAHLGMGNALLRLRKHAEAGVAFREAALDPANPDPVKALLNLGVCFMAIERPEDAVASYESALGFPMSADTKNKLYANLGQAYVACNKMQEAMDAFDTALADETFFLSDAASVDYSKAATALATGTAAMPAISPAAAAQRETVVDDSLRQHTSGMSGAIDATALPQDPDLTAAFYPEEAYGYESNDQYEDGVDRFLNASDGEVEQYSKTIAKQDRRRRNVGLKVLLAFIIAALLLLASAVVLYFQGFGYPTAESVVRAAFANPGSASQYFADGVTEDTIAAAMSNVYQDEEIIIDGVDRSMSASTVYVKSRGLSDERTLTFKVYLVRDGFGFKISDISLYQASDPSQTSTVESLSEISSSSQTTDQSESANDAASQESAADASNSTDNDANYTAQVDTENNTPADDNESEEA
ncbi:MAG: tetratricopeptide repeat protein [Eggerthellaceae bacterium]|nr:tetratricopeptide repeat protein [Eggerthellaceae bacterium]